MTRSDALLLAALAGCASVLGPWLDQPGPGNPQHQPAKAAQTMTPIHPAYPFPARRDRLTAADSAAVSAQYAQRGRRVAAMRTFVNSAMTAPLPPQRPPVLREGAQDCRAIPSLGMRTPAHLMPPHI